MNFGEDVPGIPWASTKLRRAGLPQTVQFSETKVWIWMAYASSRVQKIETGNEDNAFLITVARLAVLGGETIFD